MKPIILKIEIEGIKIFDNNLFSIDFLATKNVSESDKIDLVRITDKFFYSPVISLVGVNASGKTTALNILSVATELHGNCVSLNKTWLNEAQHSTSLLSNRITLKSYIYINEFLIKIETVLERDNNAKFNKDYQIINETLSKKRLINIPKKTLFEFSENNIIYTKESLEEKGIHYSNDISIIKNYLKSESIDNVNRPTTELSMDLGFKSNDSINNVSVEFAKYLDSSIDILEEKYDNITGNNNLNNRVYNLKFTHDDQFYSLDALELASVLSTGTRRGIIMFEQMMIALKTGGYFFIDEIEGNFNKAIIIDIVKLFYSKRSNPKGAILIFSTHYVEILDSIRRNDSIFLIEKNMEKGVSVCDNYSNLIKRNDLKKSESIISGNLTTHTTPRSNQFRKVQKSVIALVNEEFHE